MSTMGRLFGGRLGDSSVGSMLKNMVLFSCPKHLLLYILITSVFIFQISIKNWSLVVPTSGPPDGGGG